MTAKPMSGIRAFWAVLRFAGPGVGTMGSWPFAMILCILMSITALALEHHDMGDQLFLLVTLELYASVVCSLAQAASNRALLLLPLARRERMCIKWGSILLPLILWTAALYAAAGTGMLLLGHSSEFPLPTTDLILRALAITGPAFCWSQFPVLITCCKEGRRGFSYTPVAICAVVGLLAVAGVLSWTLLPGMLRALTVAAGLGCLALPDFAERLAASRFSGNQKASNKTKRTSYAAFQPPTPGRHFFLAPAVSGCCLGLAFLFLGNWFVTQALGGAKNILLAFLMGGWLSVFGAHPLRTYRVLPFSSKALTARFAAKHGVLYACFAATLFAVNKPVTVMEPDAVASVLHALPLALGASLFMHAAMVCLPPAVAGILVALAFTLTALSLAGFDVFCRGKAPWLELPWTVSVFVGATLALLGALGIYLAISRSSRPYR